jgi:uncharacterized protein YggE
MNFQLPKWLVYGLGALLMVFVALLVIGKVDDLSKTLRDRQPAHTISVPAQGKVTATPDLATITVGVQSTAPTAQAVQDQTDQKVNKIIDAVKQLGVPKEDIVTSQYNVFPQHDYQNGTDTITGYQANKTITIKIKHFDQSQDQLSKVISAATDNGSNQIDGVAMSFDNPDALREQARKIAIENAKAQAKDLADASGVKLGRVVSFQESSDNVPYPVPFADSGMAKSVAPMAAGQPATAPVIEPGSQDIVENMTVIFEIK